MINYYDHKTILITGAASGIGKRFAEKVADIADVKLILWDRNPDDLHKLKNEIKDRAEVHVTGIDVTDRNLIQLEADHFIKENLVPDIIINCAGIVVGKMFHEHSFSEIEKSIQINTTGSMWVTRAFLNEMIERGSGQIVNLASASGYIGNPRMSVYAASKWAVIGWSESLRLEMEKLNTGVGVTAVIPSYIKTGMFDGVKAPILVPLLETDEIVDLMLKGIAAGKRSIQAPFMVKLVPLIKALLPYKLFDWVAGNLLGVYKSMESFEGRTPKSKKS
ncbi:SDR family NAD(P)-dependent oxidoreductase [Rhodohalobacter sp.]|uniref:SDR family NAD(P)-dependent oxidoreductase n=1 Tax=Rhodohalobacter sp. TaxID=1974210 RepID=UPI002ACD2C4E|nr:SDR family NAD(P)-dependent oxidoreductase [Rhodohalobacter sp.]MDZ7755865.1 SDR family NAD(P)-dependent oxidoreductase [Rhodohalobacter sp.]